MVLVGADANEAVTVDASLARASRRAAEKAKDAGDAATTQRASSSGAPASGARPARTNERYRAATSTGASKTPPARAGCCSPSKPPGVARAAVGCLTPMRTRRTIAVVSVPRWFSLPEDSSSRASSAFVSDETSAATPKSRSIASAASPVDASRSPTTRSSSETARKRKDEDAGTAFVTAVGGTASAPAAPRADSEIGSGAALRRALFRRALRGRGRLANATPSAQTILPPGPTRASRANAASGDAASNPASTRTSRSVSVARGPTKNTAGSAPGSFSSADASAAKSTNASSTRIVRPRPVSSYSPPATSSARTRRVSPSTTAPPGSSESASVSAYARPRTSLRSRGNTSSGASPPPPARFGANTRATSNRNVGSASARRR